MNDEKNKKVVKIADQSSDFHQAMPVIANAVAHNRKVQAFIDGKFQDVQDYLGRFAKFYVEQHKKHFDVDNNIVFDFHVGEPLALIGGTYSYNWIEGRLRSWYWTERPDLVDGLTRLEAKEAFELSVKKFR